MQIKIEVSYYEEPFKRPTRKFKEYWFDDYPICQCDNYPKEERAEAISYITGNGMDSMEEDPIEGELIGKKIVIFDEPFDTIELLTDDYQVEFVDPGVDIT